ncbi:SAVED domain-containing protein [Pseudoalteromonas sp. NSLLW218]|uniref:SAVED domain-containing protein n=1 Tax=Pseudoalteromonas sp. NSLLW218 TaxID=2792048 RepID=UPI0018CE8AAC|nr:SAVED domain-containing protein [Pseudoalteromonas sp. NSLLW218]MBH0090841.1 SAVED domain-containing protein [Pseudoalteromonas sp. NSLLW218]
MWERFKWLLTTTFKFKKTAYPRTLWGTKLCLLSVTAGMFSLGTVNIKFESGFFVDTLGLSYKEPSLYSMYLSILLFLVGCILIFSEWNQKLRHTAKVMISAMPGVPAYFPENILDSTEKAFCREPISIGVQQSVSEDIVMQIKRYNAELEIDIFKNYILHNQGQKLYIGGLARIPFLVAYGAMLRNLTSEIIYFDKFHRDGSYGLLSDENKQINFRKLITVDEVNSSGEIGIAICFTTEININQIPKELKDSTNILISDQGISRNLIKNQDNLQKLSTQVGELIDQLSSLNDCKKVHLFLSVQSTFAIEIGRRYQEGTQQDWVIHNFDPPSQAYTWALELSKSGISLYTPYTTI